MTFTHFFFRVSVVAYNSPSHAGDVIGSRFVIVLSSATHSSVRFLAFFQGYEGIMSKNK